MNPRFFQTDLSPQQIGVVVELAVMVLVPISVGKAPANKERGLCK